MRLLSQLPADGLMGWMDTVIELLDVAVRIVTGDADRRLRALRDSLVGYRAHVRRFNAALEVPGHESEPYPERPGTLGYFAVESHSVSRARLYDGVREALTASFDSGRNPGYQGGR